MSAREIAALLFREIALVALALALPVVLAVGLYAITPKSWVADAKVLVTSGRESQPRGEIGQASDSSAAPQTTAVEILNSEAELLKSRELMLRTVDAVGARRLFPKLPVDRATGKPRDDAVQMAFARALDVRTVKDANVINVALKGPSPQVATEALAKYLQFYQELHTEAYSRPVAGFLATQLSGYEGQLRDVETKIAAFTEANRLFDPAQERKDLLDTRSNLSSSVIQLQTHAAELGSRVGALQSLQKSTPLSQQDYAETEPSETVERARSQLLDLQVQKTKLLANYLPGSRQVRDLQAQIDSVTAFLTRESQRFSGRVRTGRNPLYDEISAETVRAKAQETPEQVRARALQQAIAGIDQRLSQITESEKTLGPLQRQERQLNATLDTFRQRQAEANLLENLDKLGVANVRIIQAAAPVSTSKPSAPKLSAFVAGGAAAGIMLATVLVGLLFALKNTFIGPESVQARTKIPVLATLPVRA